jgi:hypothetical protein
MTAHAIAQTFDVGLQRLASVAFDMHQDRVIAQREAAFEQRERSMSAVGKVAARVQSDANRIAALQAEVAKLLGENDTWRVRALGAEWRLEDVAGALRTLRGSRGAA